MGNSVSTINATSNDDLGGSQSTFGRSQKSGNKRIDKNAPAGSGNAENSRVLFLLYLIHKTWNVVVDTVDPKSRRSRSSRSTSDDSGAPRSCYYGDDDDDEFDTDFIDLDDESIYNGSQYSFCSCNHCTEPKKKNPLFGHPDLRLSFCESEVSYCFGYEMAPSAGKSPPSTQIGSIKMSNDLTVGQMSQPKENQRPPVYNAEDYITSLKKYGNRSQTTNNKSIYSEQQPTIVNDKNVDHRSSTLPTKHSEYKSPIPTPTGLDCEMSLRQFGSITDLLTKLRADLRASFPSFVQELVSSPLDGVSLLLEVLRAIQLSQTINTSNTISSQQNSLQRNNQSYQRRALLDELACLQCLNLCSIRSPEAGARLGTSPIGLLPLAAAATGQGIRSRILALQLLTTACDKASLSHGSQKSVQIGHTSVSEALSTLRLRCGEPVRFRLLIGMLSSGGGSGELQAYGLKFINTFLESAENAQNRLYLQAELFQAGFEPTNMTKTITSSSPWLEKIRNEVKHFEDIRLDVDKLLLQARESDRIRSQMVVLERRVQILQEEKSVLTSMERRLQERCAELQREVFRLQGANHQEGYKSLDKRPIALPRQVPPHSKSASSEQDDEGISSSETGQSLSPEPILVLPQNGTQKYKMNITSSGNPPSKDDADATIEDVIEELENIVSDAEREISIQQYTGSGSEIRTTAANNCTGKVTLSGDLNRMEKDIVPVNILPQPPKKSRSLAHLLSSGSEFDGSDYGLLLIHNGSKTSFFEDLDFEEQDDDENVNFRRNNIQTNGFDDIPNSDANNDNSTNREILNVIMDAREKDAGNRGAFLVPSPQQQESELPASENIGRSTKIIENNENVITTTPTSTTTVGIQPLQQKFSGVFFMAEMSTPQKYPRPDIAAALEARRVTKTIDRIESYGNGLDSMIDIVMPSGGTGGGGAEKQSSVCNRQVFLANASRFQSNSKGFHSIGNQPIITRPIGNTMSNGSGSKLTDYPSGLY